MALRQRTIPSMKLPMHFTALLYLLFFPLLSTGSVIEDLGSGEGLGHFLLFMGAVYIYWSVPAFFSWMQLHGKGNAAFEDYAIKGLVYGLGCGAFVSLAVNYIRVPEIDPMVTLIIQPLAGAFIGAITGMVSCLLFHSFNAKSIKPKIIAFILCMLKPVALHYLR